MDFEWFGIDRPLTFTLDTTHIMTILLIIMTIILGLQSWINHVSGFWF